MICTKKQENAKSLQQETKEETCVDTNNKELKWCHQIKTRKKRKQEEEDERTWEERRGGNPSKRNETQVSKFGFPPFLSISLSQWDNNPTVEAVNPTRRSNDRAERNRNWRERNGRERKIINNKTMQYTKIEVPLP